MIYGINMKIKDLKAQIINMPDDCEVFIRCVVNPCGNIIEVKEIKKSVYGFFGKLIDCVIIEPDISAKMVEVELEFNPYSEVGN